MPLPRVRDAFAPDESSPRWPLLAAAAGAVVLGLLGRALSAGDDAIVDLGEGFTWRP